jgi:uncharacterized protein
MAVIRPEETSLTEHYWAQARLGQVTLQRCEACACTWHPPQPACPDCQSTEWRWLPASGAGTLVANAVVRHAPHPAAAPHLPYVICMVQLAEGPLFLCNLLDHGDQAGPPGSPVRISLGPSLAGYGLPQARLEGPAAALG